MTTDHRAALAATAREGARANVRAYKAAHPDAASLRVRSDVAAVKPRPSAMRDARVRAARLMIYDRDVLAMTNAAIASRLSEAVPGYTAPPNLLSEPFKRAEKASVSALLHDRGIALSLTKIKSPSELKAALRAYHSGAGASDRIRVEVVFTDAAVIVGQRSYPISQDAHRRIQTKGGKISVARLRELLIGETA